VTIVFPGYVPDVTALTSKATAVWADAIRDRALQVFTTAGARDTAITSPQVGQACVITTGGAAGLYVYSGPTVGWTLPWGDAWGEVAYAENASFSQTVALSATAVGPAIGSFAFVPNRTYVVSAKVGDVQQNTSAGLAKVWITDLSGSAYCTIVHEDLLAAGTTCGEGSRRLTGLTGTGGFRIEAFTSSDTLTITGSAGDPGPAWISLHDVGPNGAPS
jgi:hypothetical protein